MLTLDHYAYSNRLRSVEPAHKAGLALLVLVLCLALNRPVVGLLAMAWMWGLTAWLAGLPLRVFGQVLFAEGVFVAITVASVALSLGTLPPPAGWSWQLGPVWLSSSPAQVQTALVLLTRTLGSAAALNFLALTTPIVDLVDLMRRLRLPALLIDLMTLVYRYIFILLESLDRMVTAQSSRLGYADFRRAMTSAGLLASRLFIETYQRGQRLQIALDSRGYTGANQLRVLPLQFRYDSSLLGLGSLALASLVLARLVL